MNNKNQSTIIGSGFIAKNFIKYGDFFKNHRFQIYAAGVSNSLCKENKLFKKDKKKLIDFCKKIKDGEKLLYFSTCSIEDPSRNKNFYVRHKLEIEDIIKSNFDKYLIVRLPEVVGKNSNINTLINFFFNKIKRKEKFDLWTKAKRSIIDIEDVIKILIHFISNNKLDKNQTINIANPNKNSPIDIVTILESIIRIKADYNLVEKGKENWEIDISDTNNSIKKCGINFENDYLKNALMKYYN
tara:strand:+ start:2980 stop:3705 length:726 start_codon:yes stop_codon:yes gene_type:complete